MKQTIKIIYILTISHKFWISNRQRTWQLTALLFPRMFWGGGQLPHPDSLTIIFVLFRYHFVPYMLNFIGRSLPNIEMKQDIIAFFRVKYYLDSFKVSSPYSIILYTVSWQKIWGRHWSLLGETTLYTKVRIFAVIMSIFVHGHTFSLNKGTTF